MLSASFRLAKLKMLHTALTKSCSASSSAKGLCSLRSSVTHNTAGFKPRRYSGSAILNTWGATSPFASLGFGSFGPQTGPSGSQARNCVSSSVETPTSYSATPLSPAESNGKADQDNTENSSNNRQSRIGKDDGLLMLLSGVHDMPHPDKAAKGGEDSWFIATTNQSIGVADGVGGWAEAGVDAGIYARMFMAFSKEAAEAGNEISTQPAKIIETAYHQTRVDGSSTACVLCLNKNTLHAANLGDSGFMIVRGGKLMFQSPPQQHQFNYPFQLCSMQKEHSDPPEAAMKFEIPLEEGDILVVATDGMFDNVFADEAAGVVAQVKSQGHPPAMAAKMLCQYARMRAADTKYPSPFAYEAYRNKLPYLGGKMDDITVVVSYVVPQSKL